MSTNNKERQQASVLQNEGLYFFPSGKTRSIQLTNKSKTSLTSFPRISMPLISRTSSPSCNSPLFSAAPPFTIRLMITESISLRTVAPCVAVTHSEFIIYMKLKAIYCIFQASGETMLKENASKSLDAYTQCYSSKNQTTKTQHCLISLSSTKEGRI